MDTPLCFLWTSAYSMWDRQKTGELMFNMFDSMCQSLNGLFSPLKIIIKDNRAK